MVLSPSQLCSSLAVCLDEITILRLGNLGLESIAFIGSNAECKIITTPGLQLPRTPCQLFAYNSEQLANILKGLCCDVYHTQK